jgi:hypothetical protein
MVSHALSSLLYLSDMWYTDMTNTPPAGSGLTSTTSAEEPAKKKGTSHRVVVHVDPHLPDALYTVKTTSATGTPDIAATPAPVFFGPPRPPPPPLTRRPTESRIDEHALPAEILEHGHEFRRFLHRENYPTAVEGFKLLQSHEPEKPLKALGDWFLGVPIVATTVRTPYRRGFPVGTFILEASNLLGVMKTKPSNPREWMGRWLLARSAEYE